MAGSAFVAASRARPLRLWSQSSNGPEKKRLDAFDTHRAIIERIASAKFDNKKWEWDGITLLVREADIETG
jgi:hypothetical protein